MKFAGYILSIVLGILSNSVEARDKPTINSPEFGEAAGLTWAVAMLDENHIYSELNSWCESEIGGQNDWRIPTMEEAQSYMSSKGTGQWEMPFGPYGKAIQTTQEYSSGKMDDYTWRDELRSSDGLLIHQIITSNGIELPAVDVYVCVHASLASNKNFTNHYKLCKSSDCSEQFTNSATSTSNSGIKFTAGPSAADKAASEKALAQANAKIAADSQREKLAHEKKLAEEKKAEDAAEAKRKSQFSIVNTKRVDYQLNELTVKTWCQNQQEMLRKIFSIKPGRNQLISIGECKCQPPAAALLGYSCEFPYSYKEFDTNSK